MPALITREKCFLIITAEDNIMAAQNIKLLQE